MGRDRYESAADRKRERAVADEIERLSPSRTKLWKMPIAYHLDFLVKIDMEAKAVLEVKCREITSDQYPTIILALQKWMAGIRYHQMGLKFHICFALLDGLYLFKYREDTPLSELGIIMGGRTKLTRDSADIEPIVNIKRAWIEKISSFNVWKPPD